MYAARRCDRNTGIHQIGATGPIDLQVDAEKLHETKLVMKHLETPPHTSPPPPPPLHAVKIYLIGCDARSVVLMSAGLSREHMKDAASSHLQRGRSSCLFLHLSLSLCLWREGGGQPEVIHHILFCSGEEPLEGVVLGKSL